MGMKKIKDQTALVIGGSMAGLFAARVLSDFFQSVVVVDRDYYPSEPQNRKGVPQSFHVHRLLPKGREIMDTYFPGFIEDLVEKGAYDGSDKPGYVVTPLGELEVTSPIEDAGSSRALLEWTLRERVMTRPNIKWVTDIEITGLTQSDDHLAITGVWGKKRKTGEQVWLGADMIIDASGRLTKLEHWLKQLNKTIPASERLHTHIGYTTRYYEVPEEADQSFTDIIVQGVPSKEIGAGLFSFQENKRAGIILYFAGGGKYPSTDGETFESDISNLFDTRIADTAKGFIPITEPRGYRIQECARRHYEEAADWPKGLIAIGDAFCNFDPLFGQGISVAAIEARILDQCLKERTFLEDGFEQHFMRNIQQAIEPAWWTSGLSDLQWPGVSYEGNGTLSDVSFALTYLEQYMIKAFEEKKQGKTELVNRYFGMIGLLHSPTEVFNGETLEKLAQTSNALAAYRQKGETWEDVIKAHIPAFSEGLVV